MKTIGKFLKDARVRKRYSLAKVEKATKIKREFIEAVENENWRDLPDYPVVTGFVKNLASYLGLRQERATALLRRDYPPQKLRINPKPDVSKQFVWSPKLTFLVGVGIVIAVILGYLAFQYAHFIGAPNLEVFEPKEGQVITSTNVKVSGKTTTDAILKVNNQPVLVSDDGAFATEVQIFEGTTELVFKATSRAGKETTVRRKIIPKL